MTDTNTNRTFQGNDSHQELNWYEKEIGLKIARRQITFVEACEEWIKEEKEKGPKRDRYALQRVYRALDEYRRPQDRAGIRI